jgi:DNA-binding beta-propeller fold protein YncE
MSSICMATVGAVSTPFCPSGFKRCGTVCVLDSVCSSNGQQTCDSDQTCVSGTCVLTANMCGISYPEGCPAGMGCCGSGDAKTCNSLTSWTYNTQIATPCAAGVTCTSTTSTGVPTPSQIPTYFFVAPDGLSGWAAENTNKRISVYTRPSTTAAFSLQTTFGAPCDGTCTSDQFNLPFSVVASADGRTAWIADSGANRVSVWTRPDASSTAWDCQVNFGSGGCTPGNCGPSQMYQPGAVAVSRDALTAWVSDTGSTTSSNGRIQVWTRPDAASTEWTWKGNIGSYGSLAGQFKRPRGIYLDQDGLTMFVADDVNNRVSVWTRSISDNPWTWTHRVNFGACGSQEAACTATSADGGFNRPIGVVTSIDGNTAYIADFNNKRVAVWKRTGSITEWGFVSKFGNPPGGTTNFGDPATLADPRGVWVAGDGSTAWVADTSKQRIGIWTVCPPEPA